MYADFKSFASLQVSKWPQFQSNLVNENVEKNGDLIMAVISEVRRDKAEKKLPLNAPIKKLTVYSENAENIEVIKSTRADIAGTLKIAEMQVLNEKKSEGRKVGSSDVYIVINY